MGITAHHSARDSLAELRERRPGGETIAHFNTSSNTNSNSNSNSKTAHRDSDAHQYAGTQPRKYLRCTSSCRDNGFDSGRERQGL